MDPKMFEEMTRIVAVDDLMQLLVIRANLRLLYAELQTAAHATNNPLFDDYMGVAAATGARINWAIGDWFDKQAYQHGSEPASFEEGGRS